MDLVPVLVAYHTLTWIQVAVTSYLEHFPGDRLLVVDNNPQRGEAHWTPDCERERYWLARHPQIVVIPGPVTPGGPIGNRRHGAGVDAAIAWCREQGARTLVHLEPDCLITGSRWRENLLEALAQGAWMAGSCRHDHGPIHPTPSAWRLAELRASFDARQWRGDDEGHPRFRELVDLDQLRAHYEPQGLWPMWGKYWDAGEKAWFQAAVSDRTALVNTPDFRHFWYGSTHHRLPEAALVAKFPELRSWLERAAQPSPPVEACRFRSAGQPQSGRELARCGLLQELSGVVGQLCSVTREVCSACCAAFPPTPQELNPVVAGLLYELAATIQARGGVPECSAARAGQLQRWAEANLDWA